MIILGIGSNLHSSFGDRFKNIDLAISYLEVCGIKIIKKSSYYETPSYPDKSNPKFINIIIEVSSVLPPIDLASVLIFIEEKIERKRNKKNDPRTCDIDIIDFNSQILKFNYKDLDFTVPHEKLVERNILLFPLRQILPDWKHPKTKEVINDLIKNLPDEERKSILKVNKK